MTTPNANTIAGVVQWLMTTDVAAMVDDRIYGIELPEAEVVSMPRRAIVVAQSGRVPGLGDNSYLKLGRPRFDVKCYGATPMDALRVYYMVEALMKELGRTTVDIGDGTAILLANATYSAGPVNLRDASGQWPMALGVWGIAAHEQQLAVGMFSPMFSEMFA